MANEGREARKGEVGRDRPPLHEQERRVTPVGDGVLHRASAPKAEKQKQQVGTRRQTYQVDAGAVVRRPEGVREEREGDGKLER